MPITPDFFAFFFMNMTFDNFRIGCQKCSVCLFSETFKKKFTISVKVVCCITAGLYNFLISKSFCKYNSIG